MKIRQSIINSIIQHARKESPLEACGYLAEQDGVVGLSIPLTNADASPEHYSMDPREQFDAARKIRSRAMKTKSVYHSHPASPARPSQEDIRLAFDPHLSYVIVSLAECEPVVKSFLIVKGIVEEEEIEVVSDEQVNGQPQ